MNRYAGLFLCLAGLLAGWSAPSALAQDRVALFDQGHGQRFMIEGHEPLGLSTLAGPFQPVTKAETAAIDDFLTRGGRLCVMLHIADPARPLLTELGVVVTRTPIREAVYLIDNNPLEFRVRTLVPHPVTVGLKGFDVYGCWGLRNMNDSSRVLAWSSPRTWCDLDGNGRMGPEELPMPEGVLAGGERGKGGFLVFGDDAIFQNKFLKGENLKLARNLAVWLKGGGK